MYYLSICLLLLLLLLIVYLCNKSTFIAQKRYFDDIARTIKTGDLLLFSKSKYGIKIDKVTYIIITNDGVVSYLDDDEEDVAGDTNMDITMKKQIKPLQPLINKYKGNLYLLSLIFPLKPLQLKQLDDLIKNIIPTIGKNVSKNCVITNGKREKAKCSEQFINMGEKLGLLSLPPDAPQCTNIINGACIRDLYNYTIFIHGELYTKKLVKFEKALGIRGEHVNYNIFK